VFGPKVVRVSLGGGDDSFYAIDGSDPFWPVVEMGPGDDRIDIHDNIAASLDTGDGANVVTVGPHSMADYSQVTGGAGPDEIHARNGSAETICCGDGVDTVVADRSDHVFDNCESVDLG
jgi:hypothetical protein